MRDRGGFRLIDLHWNLRLLLFWLLLGWFSFHCDGSCHESLDMGQVTEGATRGTYFVLQFREH